MKTTITIAFLSCCLIDMAYSQDIPTPATFERAFKHELSLDISPVLKWAIGPAKSAESAAITYRYFFKPSHALRIGFRSSFNRGEELIQPGSMTYSLIEPDTLKVEFVVLNENLKWQRHVLKTGYEYRLGNKRVKGLFGIDLINGLERTYTYGNAQNYSSKAVITDSSAAAWNVFTEQGENIPYSSPYNTYYVIGFTPNIGVNISLNNRWAINATMLYDFYYNFPVSSNSNVRGFSIDLEALISDISLTYNFGKNKN